MWNPDGVGWILFTFGMDTFIVAVILLAVREVSTFLRSERDLRDHALERICELMETGKISAQEFETLKRGLEHS